MKFKFPLEVAVIDDEPDIVDLVESVLEDIPELTPHSFTQPVKALEAIRKKRIRLVFTDLDMPEMSGEKLILECKKLGWNIDFIVMTALMNRDLAYRCFEAGARQIIIKPSGLEDIRSAFIELVERYRGWHQTLENVTTDFSDRALAQMAGDEEL